MLGVWLLLACNCFILQQQECHRFYAKKVYFCRHKVVKDFRRKILRGKQVRILYSTRCCKFRERSRKMSLSKDGKTPLQEQVRKPAIYALLIASGGRRIQKRP